MILIEGTPLHCFEPRMHFINTGNGFDERYNYLNKAIVRSKAYRDGHNYKIGEKVELKNEYMEYANNLLIIHMNKEETKFFIILKSQIFDVVEDSEATEIKNFFETHKFSVIDSYGKELYIHNYDEFRKMVDKEKENQIKFDEKLQQYHKHMDQLFELRRKRTESLCCFISEYFNKMVDLSDEIGKEMCDALSEIFDNDENNVFDKFIHKPNEDENDCILFGLYLTCLRAYSLNYDAKPLSLDEKIRLGFMKEFNYFLSMNNEIIDKYGTYFNLRKIEIEAIKQLLSEEGLLEFGEWCEPAEINIL